MTTKPSKLSADQRHRLIQARRLTVDAYERLLLAQIEGHESELLAATADHNQDAAYFEQLCAARGLEPGDLVRITADGELWGQEGVIKDWADYGLGCQLVIDWPEGSPCRGRTGGACHPRPTEVELVEARA